MPKYYIDFKEFDSLEEICFYQWCVEAKSAGYIYNYEYHNISYEITPKQTYNEEVKLKTKTKYITKHLLHPHIVTPDFVIYPTDKFNKFKHGLFSLTDNYVIDIKGGFQQNDGSRAFSINQKLVYDKYKVYTNKVEISGKSNDFFLRTWLPYRNCFQLKEKLYKKDMTKRKPYLKAKTLKEL
jgi:hypothetical protein